MGARSIDRMLLAGGVAGPIVFITTFIVPGTYGVADAAGLLQRIAIVGGFGWLAVASARELGAVAATTPAARRASRA